MTLIASVKSYDVAQSAEHAYEIGTVLGQFYPSAKLFIDEAAASKLQLFDDYRWMYDNKPKWQQDAWQVVEKEVSILL